MRNRTFKVKVINLVFETLKKKYENLANGTLFFDFDKVTRFGNECALPDVFTEERLKRGECDVKHFHGSVFRHCRLSPQTAILFQCHCYKP